MPVQAATTAGAAAEEGGAAPLLRPEELEVRRSDGFRTLLAPQLRGEGNWPKVALYAAYEARTFFCADALLTCVPFWFKVTAAPWAGVALSLPGSLSCSVRLLVCASGVRALTVT